MKSFMQKKANEKKKKKITPELRRQRITSICFLAAFIIASVVIALTVGKDVIAFVSDSQRFRAWINEQGIWGMLAFIGIVCLQVFVAIIPGEAVEIAAGYAFGAWEGMLLCLIGTAVSSVFICLFTRRFGVKMLEAFVPRDKIDSLSFMRSEKRLNLLVFILFFIPGTPKDILTYFIGLTPMKIPTFLVLSSIARIPSVITSTLCGHALGTNQFGFAVAVFAVSAVISLAGLYLYNRIIQKKEKKKNGQ